MRTQFFLSRTRTFFIRRIIIRGHMLRCVSKPDKFRVRFQTFDRQVQRSICLSNDDHAIMTNFQAQRDFADSSRLRNRRSVERRRSRVTYSMI